MSAAAKPTWAWSTVDDPKPHFPRCDRCEAFARWSVARWEGEASKLTGELIFITRWFACGNHLNRVLMDEEWNLDEAHIYDLTSPPERS